MLTLLTVSGHQHKKILRDTGETPGGTGKPENKDIPLKGSNWAATDDQNRDYSLSFSNEDNKVKINDKIDASYTVNGVTVSFDLSQYVDMWKTMTSEQYRKLEIERLQKELADRQREYDMETDPDKKRNLKFPLDDTANELAGLKGLPSERFKKLFEENKATALSLEPYAKFNGTLESAKKELTVMQFPVLDRGIYKSQQLVFKLQTK